MPQTELFTIEDVFIDPDNGHTIIKRQNFAEKVRSYVNKESVTKFKLSPIAWGEADRP